MNLNLLKNLIKLLVSLSLSSYALAETVTTSPLISNNFLDGSWTDNGTGQLNTMHGSGIVAGVNGGQVQTTISLIDRGINKGSINNGFTSTQSSNIYIWTNYPQSVTMRQTLVDELGNSITQANTITSSSGYQSNTIIIGENVAEDYDITARWHISVPGTSGHLGADITNPSLVLNYTYVPDTPPLSTTEQESLKTVDNEISTTDKDINKDLTTVKNTVEVKQEPTTTSNTISENTTNEKTENTESTKTTESNETTSTTEEKTTESNNEDEKSSEASVESDKTEVSKTNTRVSKVKVNKVEVKLNNLFKENEKTLLAMVDNTMIDAYNVPFYKEREFYANQVNIFDNRILYNNVNLHSYTNSDPLNVKWKAIQENKFKINKLQAELAALKGKL